MCLREARALCVLFGRFIFLRWQTLEDRSIFYWMRSAHDLGSDQHPMLAALRRAPVGEPFSEEERAALDAQVKAIEEGRTQLVAHEDRDAWRAEQSLDIIDAAE